MTPIEDLLQRIEQLSEKVGYYEKMLEHLGIKERYPSNVKKKGVIIQHDFRKGNRI